MLCSLFVIPLFYCSKKQQMDQEPKQGDDGIKDVQDGSEEQSSCSATDSSQLVGQSQFFLTTDGAHKAILLCRPTSQDAWRNDRTSACFFSGARVPVLHLSEGRCGRQQIETS